jgi:iron complex outermembrane receptor protein
MIARLSPSLFFLALFTLLCTCVRAQTIIPDSNGLMYSLPIISVQPVDELFSLDVPAPLTTLRLSELPVYDNASLLSSLNRIAGVRFEQRATGSYRIAIRGASLRAPFGVRNVQVFWNGIPFGEPGGDVPLNFIDAINVDEVTVIRGPNGGRYGPGTAGTLLLGTQPLKVDSIPRVRLSLTGGSYGFLRTDAAISRPNKFNGTDDYRVGIQRTDGYREHSAMERATVQYSSNLGHKTKLHALYTDLSYELPGGLNAEQAAENPRQARPGSVDKNASINYQNLLLGLTNRKSMGPFSTETSLYATGFYFDHPFNFDYKREVNLGAGGRTSVSWLKDDWALNAGAMLQLQQRNGQNFENTDGRPADLNFSDEIFSEQGLFFGEVRYAPGYWNFQAGFTSSVLNYTVDRTFDSNGEIGITEFSATQPVSLRLSVGRRSSNGRNYFYVARADGFSPPTLDEFRTNEGGLNVDLAAEIGTNYELGYRYDNGQVRLEAIGFLFALDEAITTFTDDRGTQLFRNAGKTRQLGLELSADFPNLTDLAGGNLRGYASYTFYDFVYQDLARNGTSLVGQNIPGAAPHTLNLELGWSHPAGPYTSIFYNFLDTTPLNDANDVFADAHHLVRATAGYKTGSWDFFLSGNNLLDDNLNLGNDLNVRFGGRYFQPAAGRTVLAGVRLAW